jgi:hypothetical protein
MSESFRQMTKYTRPPEQLPMYAANLMKYIPEHVTPSSAVYLPYWADELGNIWTTPEPVWYYDLYFCTSHRKYGTECLQARTKRDAIKKIKSLWRVTRIER